MTPISRRRASSICLLLAAATSVAALPAHAATITKANNANALNLSASWVSGIVPGTNDVALFDGTLSSSFGFTLGGDLSLGGILLTNPSSAVSISGANILTLGYAGIDMSAATQDLTISSSLSLGTGNQSWNVTSGRTLTLNTGTFTRSIGSTLNVPGAGTVAVSMTGLANDATSNGGILGPWATYGTGSNTRFATLSSGTITGYTPAATEQVAAFNWTSSNPATNNYDVAGVSTAIGVGRVANTVRYTGAAGTQTYGNSSGQINLTVNGILNVGSGALTFARGGTNTASGIMIGANYNRELVVTAANNGIIFTAPIINNTAGASALTTVGPNTVTLSATNTYTGATTVASGTLLVNGSGSVNTSSGILVNGGTLIHTSSVVSSRTLTLTRGTVDGTGTLGTVNVANSAAAIITNGNGGTAGLTVNNLNFAGAATLNARVATGATPFSVGTLTTTPANGQIALNLAAPGGWNNGVYNIIGFGSFAGAASNFSLGSVANLNSRQSAGSILVNGTYLTFTVLGDSPKWTGALSSEWSTNTLAAPKNWKLITAGTITDYISGDDVLFDDSAVNGTVNISNGDVTPRTLVVNNSSLAYTFTGSSAISGTVGLTKTGAGKLTIANNNTYTGNTSLSDGTTVISGQLGNTAITLNSGTLSLQNSNAISQNTLTLAGGTLVQTVDNALSGSTSLLIKTNTTLAGNNNSYSGDTTINSGTGITLTVVSATAAGNSRFNMATGASLPVLNLHIDGSGSNGTIAMSNSIGGNSGITTTIDVNNNGGGNTGNQIQLNGTPVGGGNAVLNITGGNGYSLKIANYINTAGTAGATVLNPTTASVTLDTFTSSTALVKTLTLDGTNAGNFVTGTIGGSGTLGLLKSNTSTWTLSGFSSYTGPTVVSGGKLILAGSNNLPTGTAVTLNGGILDASAGSQQFGALTVNAGGTLAIGIGNSVSVSNAATFNGGTLSLLGSPTGSVQLMGYGSFTGAFATVLNMPAGYTLQYKPNELDLVAFSNLFFSGAAGNGTWDNGTTLNFTDGTNTVAYSDSNPAIVTFDDTVANGGHNLGQFNINLASTVSPVAVKVTANNAAYTFSGSDIGNSSSLTKSGNGTLTLNASNSYNGGTTLSGGKLNLGNNGALGSGPLTVTGGTLNNTSGADMTTSSNIALNLNGDLTFLGTNSLDIGNAAATVGGSGDRTLTVAANTLSIGELRSTTQNFTKAGNGTLVLTSTGASGSGVAIDATGATVITGPSNGTIIGGTLTVSGTLQYNRSGATGGDPSTGDLSVGALAGNGTLQNGAGEARWIYVTGTASASTFGGVLADGGTGKLALNINGGTTTLAGVNTYTDQTTVNQGVLNFSGSGSIANSQQYNINNNGILQVDSSSRLGAGTLNITSTGHGPGDNTSRLELSGNSLVTGQILLAPRNAALNSTAATDAIRNVSGNNTLSGLVTITTGGNQARIRSDAGLLTLSGNISTLATSNRGLYLDGAGNGTLSGVISDGTANVAATISIVKDGTGAWSLTGNNTTTGSITVNAGKLVMQTVSNTHSGVSVTGGTFALGGAGQTFYKPVTIAGAANAWTGQVDVGRDTLVVLNADATAKAAAKTALVNQIQSANNGGAWNGNGITSSAIPGNPNATLALVDNADLGWTSSGAATLDNNSLFVTRALIGDVNLDGNVDLADYDRWYKNVGTGTAYSYAAGDVNLDGNIDLADYDLWYKHVGAAPLTLDSQPALGGGVSAVPEPTSLAVLALGSAALLANRRRRR